MANSTPRLFQRYGSAIYIAMALLGILISYSTRLVLGEDLTKELGKDLVIGLGVNILSVSVVFFLVDRFFQFNILNDEKEQLQSIIDNLNSLSSNLKRETLPTIIHKKYPADLVRKKIKNAKKEIKISGTWPKSTEPLPETINEPIKKKIPIQIMFLLPESDTVRSRLKSMLPDLSATEQLGRVSVALSSLSQFIKKIPDKESLIIKLSPISLSFRLIVCDSWFLIGFYWYGKTSAEGTHLEFDKTTNPQLFNDVLEAFDTVFSDSKNQIFK